MYRFSLHISMMFILIFYSLHGIIHSVLERIQNREKKYESIIFYSSSSYKILFPPLFTMTKQCVDGSSIDSYCRPAVCPPRFDSSAKKRSPPPPASSKGKYPTLWVFQMGNIYIDRLSEYSSPCYSSPSPFLSLFFYNFTADVRECLCRRLLPTTT